MRELYRNNDLQGSTVCTYARSGVVLTTPAVLFQDTYIFLLQYVRATRKVSYMLYKVHLWESCTVTTTFKIVLYYVCTFGCRAHHPRRFIPRYLYILAPICQGYSKSIIYAILVAVVRELYRNNDVQKSTVCNVCTFGCRTHHPRRFIQRYLYILAPTCQSYAKCIIYAI